MVRRPNGGKLCTLRRLTKLLGTDQKFAEGCSEKPIVKMLLAHVSKVGIIKSPLAASSRTTSPYFTIEGASV